MKIYVIRHAHALDGENDAARPLSAKGRRQAERMARWLRRQGRCEARELWHSPLVRSRVTAELLARGLGGKRRLVEVDGLGHAADPAIMAKRLARVRRPVAVVGHEPHLSALVTHLLCGRNQPPAVVLRKGAALALERSGRTWAVRWLLGPREA